MLRKSDQSFQHKVGVFSLEESSFRQNPRQGMIPAENWTHPFYLRFSFLGVYITDSKEAVIAQLYDQKF